MGQVFKWGYPIELILYRKASTMIEIMYSPNDVGHKLINSHGRLVKVRKYHMDSKDKKLARDKWLKDTQHVNQIIKDKAGDYFFNPFRKGVYYYQIYAMFLLGANSWHSFGSVLKTMEGIMSEVDIRKEGITTTAWEKFKGKSQREQACRCKDYKGRVQENMIFFQRLTKFHPYGYKLKQAHSAVDIRRESMPGFSGGRYLYRLSTYATLKLAMPIRDYEFFNFPKHERKYVNNKFIGTLKLKGRTIVNGEIIDEMS